jgi:hypothetical protein
MTTQEVFTPPLDVMTTVGPGVRTSAELAVNCGGRRCLGYTTVEQTPMPMPMEETTTPQENRYTGIDPGPATTAVLTPVPPDATTDLTTPSETFFAPRWCSGRLVGCGEPCEETEGMTTMEPFVIFPPDVMTTPATISRTVAVIINCGGRRCGPPAPIEETPEPPPEIAQAETSVTRTAEPSTTPSGEQAD